MLKPLTLRSAERKTAEMRNEDGALAYTAIVDRLAEHFPQVTRGHIEAVIVEEHEIIVGGVPGDLVPAIVADGVRERIARAALGDAEAEVG